MLNQQPLSGIRIHISCSIHEDSSSELEEFITRLATRLFSEGATVVHGSHPSLIPSLKNAVKNFIAAGGNKDSLTLVRSKQYAQTDEQIKEIRDQQEYSIVQIVPTQTDDNRALTPMRDWMAERSDAVICVGGKWWNINKDRAGVPKELNSMLDLGKPGFIIAGFGGAIDGYLKDHPEILSKLKNGLCHEQNKLLAESTIIEELINKIITQLKNLPLVKKNVSKGRNFRILALDGGGLRGAFTAAVLAKWDDMIRQGGGNNLISHFDLVAGTSTGAILAIGLALGLSPNEILNFYKEKGALIFPKDRNIRHWIKSKHESVTLRKLLTDVYQDKKISEASCCRLVIPTVRANRGHAEVIVTPHTSDRTAFRDISAVDAALASSAAPTYFDELEWDGPIGTETFLDGGVWANNPILPALAEAVRHLKIPLDRIDVLSIGTLSNESDFTQVLGKGKAGWAPKSTDLFFAAQEHGALILADSFLGPTRHFRVNQLTPTEIKLDDTEAIEDMVNRGNQVGKDSFIEVHSRFLDGVHADEWTKF